MIEIPIIKFAEVKAANLNKFGSYAEFNEGCISFGGKFTSAFPSESCTEKVNNNCCQ